MKWQFVLGASRSSRLIAWWGMGYNGYSHVDALLPNGDCLGARSDLVGGAPAGFQRRPAGYEEWKRRTVLELPGTPQEQGAWEDSLDKKIGAGYDQADILGLIIGRPLMEPGHWICSAAQLESLQEIGRIPKLTLEPQQCPPNMLFAMLEAIGARVVT